MQMIISSFWQRRYRYLKSGLLLILLIGVMGIAGSTSTTQSAVALSSQRTLASEQPVSPAGGMNNTESYIDFGDAGEPYQSFEADDGPRHLIVPEYYLGAGVSSEADWDGTPDSDSSDDGITINSQLFGNEVVTIGVTASVASDSSVPDSYLGSLNGWIDFNRDGDFEDANEQIITDVLLNGPFPQSISFTVPTNVVAGNSYARFRYSTQTGLGPLGMAYNGEVEDYAILLSEPFCDVWFTPPDTVGIFRTAETRWQLNNMGDGSLADNSFIYGTSDGTPLAGDWDGDFYDTVGYRAADGTFFLNDENDDDDNDTVADTSFAFGSINELPVVGDWNNDTIDTVGVYNQSTATFSLKNTNDSTGADLTFIFGTPGSNAVPLAGDWNGDGTDTVGLYDPDTGRFSLTNTNASGDPDTTFIYGSTSAPWVPLAGDWDGDGTDSIGLYNPNVGKFILRNTAGTGAIEMTFFYYFGATGELPITGQWGPPNGDVENCFPYLDRPGIVLSDTNFWRLNDFTDGSIADNQFTYGESGMTPFAGDWDGDNYDTVGYRTSSGIFVLNDANDDDNLDPEPDTMIEYGSTTDLPVVGDWDGDDIDTIGIYSQGAATFSLKNTNDDSPTDLTFVFGTPGNNDIPLIGDWDGDTIDTIGLYDPDTGRFSLRNSNSAGDADISFIFGSTSDPWVPLAGDWDGDGIDSIGLYNPNVGKFILRNTAGTGAIELTFFYYFGATNEIPLVGNWADAPVIINTIADAFDPAASNQQPGGDWFGPDETEAVEPVILQPGVYEIEDYLWLLRGEWQLQHDLTASNGVYALSSTAADDSNFLFAGSGLELSYVVPIAGNPVFIELDGDIYQAGNFPDNDVTRFDTSITFTDLNPNIVHEVRIYSADGPIAIDRFVITE